jgi:hypothetical protein
MGLAGWIELGGVHRLCVRSLIGSTEEARFHGGRNSKSWWAGAANLELDGQLGCKLFKRPHNDIDGHIRCGLADAWMLFRARDESCPEAIIGGRFEVTAVGRAHHALTGLEIEGIHCRQVDRRLGFVIPGQIGAEDGIPMNLIPPGEIAHERYVPI